VKACSRECESPAAFRAPARGGTARPVAPEDPAAESLALGWAPDGRALVLFPKGVCGSTASPPGVYAIDPAGKRALLARGRKALLVRP
jgi:hypothetical protein